MNVGNDSTSRGRGQGRDFDLNLAPIIDCFTVLIAFMLISSTFLAIGILDAASAVTGSTADVGHQAPAVTLEIHLGTHRDIQFKVTGKEKINESIASLKEDWDFSELTTQVESLKMKWPDTKLGVLVPDEDLNYLQLVRVMEALKPHLGTVLLGGF